MPESEDNSRERELRIRAANLELTLGGVGEDLRRLERARIHRWPAALARASRALVRRPVVTGGALERALRRIEEVELSAGAARPVTRRTMALSVGAGWGASGGQGGDEPFAKLLGAALSRIGWKASVVRHRHDSAPSAEVVVHLRGRGARLLRPEQRNVLWVLSHPEEVTPAECDAYDLVLVASEKDAERLAALTDAPVRVLEQATDPDTYRPGPQRDIPVAFVGNRRGGRPVVDAVAPAVPELQVWGEGWESFLGGAQWRGPRLDPEEVAGVYGRSLVVLSDHWPAMRERGYLANRVYDALAAGAWVVSDAVSGVEPARFGDALVLCRSPEDAVTRVRALVRDGGSAPATGAEAVRRDHTFDRRAAALTALLEEIAPIS